MTSIITKSIHVSARIVLNGDDVEGNATRTNHSKISQMLNGFMLGRPRAYKADAGTAYDGAR